MERSGHCQEETLIQGEKDPEEAVPRFSRIDFDGYCRVSDRLSARLSCNLRLHVVGYHRQSEAPVDE